MKQEGRKGKRGERFERWEGRFGYNSDIKRNHEISTVYPSTKKCISMATAKVQMI